MEEKQKIDVAVFRYSVIQEFVCGIKLDHGERERLLREKCSRKWLIPHSCKTSISRSTIQRWIDLYKSSGDQLDSLHPMGRKDKGVTRVLDENTCLLLTRLRHEMPDVTVPFIMKFIEKRGIAPIGLSQSTVYRFFHQENIMKYRTPPENCLKFEEAHPNETWQSDVMHGPHVEIDGKQRKTYLIAFIDDHSRLIVYGQFYASENTQSFMHALEQAFLRRGLPRKLYVDNGSAFRSKQLMHTLASLAVALIHSRPYKPQGRGKIERFFKTVRSQFLPGFAGTTLQEINVEFQEWLDREYNVRKHSATGKKPLERFIDGIECVRTTPDNLKEHFRKTIRRKMNKDRTIILDKRLYEGPVELIGKQVELLFHENEYDLVELRYQQKSWGFLKQVDLNVNCRVKRGKNNDSIISVEGKTVAETGKMWGGTS